MIVEYERRGDVGVLLLGDERRHNALSTALVTEMLAALESSRADGARAIVITSRLSAFCAGADITDMLETDWLETGRADPDQKTPLHLFEAIEADPRPIICATGGLTLGGGVELLTVCDLAIASDEAMFMLPELGLGVLPNTALARLPDLIGWRRTMDLVLTRRRIKAAEAKEMGLVNRIVDADDLFDEAVALAAAIVRNAPPGALAAAKRARPGPDWPRINAILEQMVRAEWSEGVSAFVEKRSADYEPFWSAR